MAGNKPFTREEYEEYNQERKRMNKAYSTHCKTMKVRYKVLCSLCEYNAENRKKIILNCPNCKIRYWNNCSVRQVKNGEILQKLQAQNKNLEWVMAYNPDGTLGYKWQRHEPKFEQDMRGNWIPKE